MNPLINITKRTIGQHSIPTVNARELHDFLEVGKVFAAWINERIQQYQFSENIDYVIVINASSEVFSETGKNSKNNQPNKGGRPSKDYFITLDMAKELAMVERTEKGREARRYFIACEQALIQRTRQQPNYGIAFQQLMLTVRDTLRSQNHILQKITKMQEQSLLLQEKTITLLEHSITQNTRPVYRMPDSNDITTVIDMLKQGQNYRQISQALGISRYFVALIGKGQYTVNPDGTLSGYRKKYS